MNRELCQRYLEDPEANAAHVATCAECRAIEQQLSAKVRNAQVHVDALPLAPWEEASHRSWPLVTGGLLTLIAIATALFAMIGVSPLVMLRDALPSFDILASVARFAGGAIQNAPTSWQIGIAISFIAVNAILIALLRRSPKGIDV
ncbi:MAG TPA: hypothetical protein VF057_11230 [Thermoanaerobaculia bacterium]